MIQRRYSILVDTREKKPLRFPSFMPMLRSPLVGDTTTVQIHTIKQKLDTADYVLQGFEHLTGIERKGSIREVANNCLTFDRDRLRRCLDRMRKEFRYPILLLEGTVKTLLSDRRVHKPYRALDALHRLLAEYRIPLLMLPSASHSNRQIMGETVARILINNAIVAGSNHEETQDKEGRQRSEASEDRGS